MMKEWDVQDEDEPHVTHIIINNSLKEIAAKPSHVY